MKSELLAPAGSIEGMRAAIAAGADAVYMGGELFGARAYANNPEEEGLKEAIDYVHLHKKKLYLTVNTLLKNKELKSGAIILMHSGAKYTKDALESVILGLREQGYELVPVSELIYKENYHLDVTGRQIKNK